jgi:transcriptional regulator with XRE-family HTH domain
MGEKNTVGDKLKAVRASRSLSQDQVADRAGIRVEVVAEIESGALVPSLAPLIRIARALGVRLGTFLDDRENVAP